MKVRIAVGLLVTGLVGCTPAAGVQTAADAHRRGDETAARAIHAAGDKVEPRVEDRGEVRLPGWRKWTVGRKDQPALDVYGVVDPSRRLPVLVMVTGSRCVPLFREKEGKIVSPLFLQDAAFFRKLGVHAIAVERRGIRSFEPIPPEIAAKDARIRCSREYGGIDKQERIEDVATALGALAGQPWFGEMLLMGHSEGVDIATGIAKRSSGKGIASLGLFAGAAASSFFDVVVGARRSGDDKQVKDIFDDLVWITSPRAEGKYGGYPVAKFISYAVDSSTLDDALATEVPLFVANGTLDHKAPIEGADLFVVEVLRKQKSRPLYYVNYPDMDHEFRDKSDRDNAPEVFETFIRWSLAPTKDRKFEIVRAAPPEH